MSDYNLILDTDSYKTSHWQQMPEGSEFQSSYIESRGGEYTESVFFGLQPLLMDRLTKPITLANINEAEAFWTAHGVPFFRQGWLDLLNKHGGYMPIEIQAVPEGLVIPTQNALVQAVNTDPEFYWLTSYLETMLLRAVWYPTTVASLSYACKQAIWESLLKTSDDPTGQISFKLHDFGARGVSSMESAGLGGMAHLVNFMGSDTMTGVMHANRYYGEPMAGFSIPASEHSTITSWGGPDFEIDAFRNMIRKFGKPGKLFACVSDSYDIFRACRELWPSLKEELKATGAKLVVRPDSGDPTKVPIQVVEALGESFGFTVNSKGYKVLDPCIGVIQGDGINRDSLAQILVNLNEAGWSTDNLAFGMGGGLLQQLNRDTMKFAMKCSALKVKGYWRDVYKDPITDKGKQSKKGILDTIRLPSGDIQTIRRGSPAPDGMASRGWKDRENLLQPVFRNGQILKTHSFSEIRARANEAFQ
jgi:nicotinamide phosphoribosyltransferase